MPLFEYACCKCLHEFEELASSDETNPPCPECGDADVKKLMSACAAKTDGSGDAPDFPAAPPMGGGCSGGG